jgi:hypothetical protein
MAGDTLTRSEIEMPRYPATALTLAATSLSIPAYAQYLTDSIWFEANKGVVVRKQFRHTGMNSASERTVNISLRDVSTEALPLIRAVPSMVRLFQNYPNPFNPSTVVPFTLEEETIVLMEVFNLLGERVATLVDRKMQRGYHEEPFDGTGLPAGTYFLRLHIPVLTKTLRMILIR